MKKLVCLVLCAVLLCGLVSACSSGSKPTLKVYNWGDYIDEAVLDMFEEEYGVEVVYDTYDTNEAMYTNLVSKGDAAGYDVVIPSDYMISKMINEGMLAKIDVSAMENYSLIEDRFKNLGYDPNNEYSVPYMWGTLGILYNTTLVDGPVESWSVLFDENYSGRLFMMDSVRDSIGVALDYLGYSMNSTNDAELAEAEALLKEQKPLVLDYTGDEVKDKMIGGEAALAVVYAGDAITCINENSDLKFAVPVEGSNLFFDAMCVLETSENKELAEQFIDFMCRTDIAEMNRAYINYSSPQTEVVDALPDEIKNDGVQYPASEQIADSEVFVDLGEYVEVYNEIWNRIIFG